MNIDIKGHLYAIGKTEEIALKNGSVFYKRSAIVNFAEGDDGQYIQHISIEFMGEDKVKVLDAFKTTDAVIAHCDLRGRLWVAKEGKDKGKEKAFNSLGCWRLEKVNEDDAVNNDIKVLPPQGEDNNEDRLPF